MHVSICFTYQWMSSADTELGAVSICYRNAHVCIFYYLLFIVILEKQLLIDKSSDNLCEDDSCRRPKCIANVLCGNSYLPLWGPEHVCCEPAT